MKRGIALAWIAAMGIISWREIKVHHGPPIPGRLLGASGLFILLGLLGEYEPASGVAAALAWGYDIAALLTPGVLPELIGGTPKKAPAAKGSQPAKPPAG